MKYPDIQIAIDRWLGTDGETKFELEFDHIETIGSKEHPGDQVALKIKNLLERDYKDKVDINLEGLILILTRKEVLPEEVLELHGFNLESLLEEFTEDRFSE